jgi:DNA-directed RNA polymerase specialized sigma24 family protein
MKNEERNELFLKHQNLIGITIRRNRRLIAALRLETEDVEQELSIRMLKAIDSFNPSRSPIIEAHILSQLQSCVLDIKKRHKPHGMTGIRPGAAPEYVYADKVGDYDTVFEIPAYDDDTVVCISDFLEGLTEYERETLNRKLEGHYLKKKQQTAAIAGIGERLKQYYNQNEYEGRKAA